MVTAAPAWQRALNLRSIGLNRLYGLPKPTPKPKPAAPAQPFWQTDPRESAEEVIDAMLQQIQAQQDAAYERARQQAAAELAQGQALAQGLQALGISQNVQRAFQDAAQAQAGLAQGFSGQIRDQAAAQAADQVRQLSGTGQEAAVRNQGENMGNVQYGAGGYIPSAALNTQAAAFGAEAALQPGFALQFGQINQARRMQDWLDEELPQYDTQRSDVRAKLPQLYQQMLGEQFDRENTLYERRMAQREYNDKRKAQQAAFKQDAMDRQMEAIAVKLSQGLPLTARDKRLLDTYGLGTQTANSLIRGNQQAASAKAKADLQAAKDRAAMAKAKYQAAQQAAREAKAQAARSKLEADKAAYRRALEAQKAAQNILRDAMKAVSSAKNKAGNAGGADSFFPGG